MKSFKYISLFTLHFLLYSICSAQKEQLSFNLVPPPVGLHPGNKAGVQDSQGYMWFGTYQAPLRRYDGYNYTFYSHDPLDSNSLAQNWVEALCAGRNGIIWAGTAYSGLERFDPATGRFKHFMHDPEDNNSLSSNSITSISEDRNGKLWIGTSKGLNKYNPETGRFHRYFHNPADSNSLSCDQVEKVYEDKAGNIWVGTGSVWNDEGGETNEGGLTGLITIRANLYSTCTILTIRIHLSIIK